MIHFTSVSELPIELQVATNLANKTKLKNLSNFQIDLTNIYTKFRSIFDSDTHSQNIYYTNSSYIIEKLFYLFKSIAEKSIDGELFIETLINKLLTNDIYFSRYNDAKLREKTDVVNSDIFNNVSLTNTPDSNVFATTIEDTPEFDPDGNKDVIDNKDNADIAGDFSFDGMDFEDDFDSENIDKVGD
jgi:hypothetical protein